MSLDEYIKKRNFSRTPEPKAKSKNKKNGRIFVVQKHEARRLHYDFRLEWAATLKSWAVPKGPSLDPSEKRLAVHVEDHPIQYANFEGTIPEKEYGAGTVIVWDQGEWEPDEDPESAYIKGRLHFTLHGQKLKGAWTLARMGKQAAEGKENWLLIKKHDEFVSKNDITISAPESIITGKKIAEISSAALRETNSKKSKLQKSAVAISNKSSNKNKIASTKKSQIIFMPKSVTPQLATLVKSPPKDGDWLHEIKYDGYRIMARIEDGQTRLLTRGNLDWTKRFPSIANAVSQLPFKQAWLDGEIAIVDKDGTTSFQSLQTALSNEDTSKAIYYVFDLLYLNNESYIDKPLIERKQALSELLKPLSLSQPIKYSEHVEGSGVEFFHQACKLSIEGIISKLSTSAYRSGRSEDWLKVKCLQEQEFVILGFTKPNGSRFGLGALLLGVFNENQELIYAGRVGTGFNKSILIDLLQRLKPLMKHEPSIAILPSGVNFKGATWVDPKLIAQVEFSNWTRDRLLRHSTFKGLREDKSPLEVTREMPLDLASNDNKKIESLTKAKVGQAIVLKGRETKGKKSQVANLHLSHPEKILYPDISLTKLDLAKYYISIYKWMLPDIINRPLTLVRCPEGWMEECFFQKHVTTTLPEGVRRVTVDEDKKADEYFYVDHINGLIALVQLGALEIHGWSSTVDRIEYPDRIVFDLDPDESVKWTKVLEAALLVRERLTHLGWTSFVRTTGGKGLHVVVPLSQRNDWLIIKAVAKAIAEGLVSQYPALFTAKLSKLARRGKIFIDYLRNNRGATAVINYSTRAKQGAPVAVPLQWEELIELQPNSFTVNNVVERMGALKNDPWQGYHKIKQSVTKQIKSELKL